MTLFESVSKAKRVFLIGNGGSAANAIHIANDWIAHGVDARPLLDIATITAIANDFGYENIFSRQIQVIGSEGDMLLALSGSGNSPNILRAIKTAKKKGMVVWAIVGSPHSKASRLAHFTIEGGVDMQDAEEKQLLIGHEVMRCLSVS